MNGKLRLFIPNSIKKNGLNRGTKWKRNVTNHLNFKNKRFNMLQSNSLQTNEINGSIWQVKHLEWSHWSVYSEGHTWLSWLALTASAGGKGTDLAEIQRHHCWKKQKQGRGSDVQTAPAPPVCHVWAEYERLAHLVWWETLTLLSACRREQIPVAAAGQRRVTRRSPWAEGWLVPSDRCPAPALGASWRLQTRRWVHFPGERKQVVQGWNHKGTDWAEISSTLQSRTINICCSSSSLTSTSTAPDPVQLRARTRMAAVANVAFMSTLASVGGEPVRVCRSALLTVPFTSVHILPLSKSARHLWSRDSRWEQSFFSWVNE